MYIILKIGKKQQKHLYHERIVSIQGVFIMKKFNQYIETWLDGKQVRGIKNVPPATVWECVDVYNAIIRQEKPSFINGTVKEILDKCGIKTVVEGIGWKIA